MALPVKLLSKYKTDFVLHYYVWTNSTQYIQINIVLIDEES